MDCSPPALVERALAIIARQQVTIRLVAENLVRVKAGQRNEPTTDAAARLNVLRPALRPAGSQTRQSPAFAAHVEPKFPQTDLVTRGH